jgi:hypothetical protein
MTTATHTTVPVPDVPPAVVDAVPGLPPTHAAPARLPRSR